MSVALMFVLIVLAAQGTSDLCELRGGGLSGGRN
jgi:hypothetical protein